MTTEEARRQQAGPSAVDRFFRAPKPAPYGSAQACTTGNATATADA